MQKFWEEPFSDLLKLGHYTTSDAGLRDLEEWQHPDNCLQEKKSVERYLIFKLFLLFFL